MGAGVAPGSRAPPQDGYGRATLQDSYGRSTLALMSNAREQVQSCSIMLASQGQMMLASVTHQSRGQIMLRVSISIGQIFLSSKVM
jgi:hypothetical protein